MLLSLLFTSQFSYAFKQEIEIKQWNFAIFLGEGKIQNPIIKLDDLNLSAFPSVSYYGESFFIEGTTLGYSLLENDNLIIDVVGLLNEDGLFHHFDDHQDYTLANILGFKPSVGGGRDVDLSGFEPIERDLSYLAGINFSFMSDYFDTRVGYFHDITNVHNGYEIHFSFSKSYKFRYLNAAFEVGQVFKSKNLLDYYYQLHPNELHIFRNSGFDSAADKNTYYKIQLELPISESFTFVSSAKHTKFGDKIQESFLVVDPNYLTSFIGIRYQF